MAETGLTRGLPQADPGRQGHRAEGQLPGVAPYSHSRPLPCSHRRPLIGRPATESTPHEHVHTALMLTDSYSSTMLIARFRRRWCKRRL